MSQTPDDERVNFFDDDKFHIKARACLFTYNIANSENFYDVSFEDFREAFLAIREGHDGDRVTLCIERAESTHFHVFLEAASQIDCDSSHFEVFEVTPNCQPNTVKGSGFRASADRGHFYLACEHKNSYIEHHTNWEPCHHYVVRSKWILDFWRKGKINDDKVVDCLAAYKCLDPRDERMIECTISRNSHKRKLEHIAEAHAECRSRYKEFPVIPVVEDWFAQYETFDGRYKMLIIWGPTRMGKTEFIKARVGNAFVHHDTVSWHGYDDDVHDAIIFDDVKGIYKYVSENRHLFQANDMATVQTSSTNCYAKSINVFKKKLIITSNSEPTGDWILANSFILEIFEPLGGRVAG